MRLLFVIVLLSAFFSFSVLSIEIPADNEEFIHGIGHDANYDTAQKSALSDIVMKLSSRITSETTTIQQKENAVTKASSTREIQAYSRNIELPNVEVIHSVEKNGQWTLIVRVQRKLVQHSIKHQLDNLNDELTFTLTNYKSNYTPSCYYVLSALVDQKKQLNNLIPAFVGSGVANESEAKYYNTINVFERTLSKCEKRNKYTLTFSQSVSKEFETSTKKFLKLNGFKVVNANKKAGEIQFNIKKNQSFAFKSHITVLTAEILIFDEEGELRFEDSFKVKGSSFESKGKSLIKAENKLLNKIQIKS